jgi:crotonobetainyl-CoA:carnitine CoA-transferase CaiB-like acyl-CoA transferase
LALLDRRRTGKGQLVDVAIHDTLAVTIENGFTYWEYAKSFVHRQTCNHAQPTPTHTALFECVDGRLIYLMIILAEQKAWQGLVAWLDSAGMAADLADPAYNELAYRQKHYDHIQNIVECFCLTQLPHDLLLGGQERLLPIGMVNAPEDLLVDPHLRERAFFVEIQECDGSKGTYPGVPTRFSAFEPSAPRRAPRLGETPAEERVDP